MAYRTAINKVKRFKVSSHGGAAVELAVVFPILVLLIIGVVDYGRVFYTSITVANAARAGAEWGAHNPFLATDTVEMKNRAQADGQEAGTLIKSARYYCQCGGVPNGTCSVCGSGAAPEVFVEVTASKTVNMLLPYPGIPNNFSITRKATFRSQ